MCRLTLVLLTGAFAASGASAHAGEADGRRVLSLAMQAHGGKEKLQKLQARRMSYRAEFWNGDFKTQGQLSIQYDARMKHSFTLPFPKPLDPMDTVFDGKTLWTRWMGLTQVVKDEGEINAVKTALYIDSVLQLAELDSKRYEVTALGAAKVRGRDALGIRIRKESKPDVDLWFSKRDYLLLKSEFVSHHPLTQILGASRNTKHEIHFSGYEPVLGVQAPHRIEIINQLAIIRIVVTNMRYFERLDESFFAKP